MLSLRLPRHNGGFIRPVGECDLLRPFTHRMEFQTTKIPKRHLAQGGGGLRIPLIHLPRLGAEDDDEHQSRSFTSSAGRQAFTPFGVATTGRLSRMRLAAIASRIAVSGAPFSPSSAARGSFSRSKNPAPPPRLASAASSA